MTHNRRLLSIHKLTTSIVIGAAAIALAGGFLRDRQRNLRQRLSRCQQRRRWRSRTGGGGSNVRRARHNSCRVKRSGDTGTCYYAPPTIKLVNLPAAAMINLAEGHWP